MGGAIVLSAQHGAQTIRTLEHAKESAVRFADSVS